MVGQSMLLMVLIVAGGSTPDYAARLKAAQLMEIRGAPLPASKGYTSMGQIARYSETAHLRWADFLVREGRSDQALGPAGAATRLAPYSARPYAVVARAAVHSGRADYGRSMLDKAFQMDPWSAEALLTFSDVLRSGGDAKAAEQVLTRAVEVAGEDARVRFQAAVVSLKAGRDADAGAHLEVLRSILSGSTGEVLAAEAFLVAGRPSDALSALSKLLAKGASSDPRLYRALGRSLLGAGAPPLQAAAAFREGMRLDPDDLDSAVGFARALILAPKEPGSRERALATLAKVLVLDPGHVGALLASADLDRSRGAAGNAEGWLDKVPTHHPAYPEARNLMGLCRLDQEDPFGAIGHFKEALAARPDLRHAGLNLALAYVRAGRSSDAAASVKQALAGLPPQHPLVSFAATTILNPGKKR